MNKDVDISGGDLIKLMLGGIALIGVTTIVKGFVLMNLWEWYVVEHFGLPHISVPQGIGIALIVSYITNRSSSSKVSKDEENDPHVLEQKMSKGIVDAVSLGIIVLGLGWIIHFFV